MSAERSRPGGNGAATENNQTEASVNPGPGADYLQGWAAGYAAGYDRGYERRVEEESTAGPPSPVITFGRWFDQAAARSEWDAAATQPRPTDRRVQ